MTTTTITGLDLLQTRMAAAMGGQMPGHVQRLGWRPAQLAAFQRDRLRALLARAIERSPFHAARLHGIDPGRFELADLPRLPVMTKAQMMEHFDAAVTDPRLTRNLVERHLAGSVAEPSLLLGDYVCLVSGGSSGRRGLFVQTVSEYADFVCTVMRRPMAAAMGPAGPPPGGLVIGIVGAGSPVHSSGLGAATATAPPVRMIPAPASLPVAEIVRRLNAAQPPALLGYATKLAELAREQREGRLRLNLRSVTSMAEAVSPAERIAIGEAFGVPVIDLFVSTEGLVGHSEPGHPVLTFASDTCLAECVDDDGRPVPPGVASAKVLLTKSARPDSAAHTVRADRSLHPRRDGRPLPAGPRRRPGRRPVPLPRCQRASLRDRRGAAAYSRRPRVPGPPDRIRRRRRRGHRRHPRPRRAGR